MYDDSFGSLFSHGVVFQTRVDSFESKPVTVELLSLSSLTFPAATAPPTSLIFPKSSTTIPAMAVQNAAPNEVLICPGATDPTVNPTHNPAALIHAYHIENAPSFPEGAQSKTKTLPKACKIPVDVL